MRLEKIKLAGFKSFVDPTTVHMPSQLVGIVGPNGCGKSNIIDAVRWVMGESSAKMLRGESMADVIFNGSSSRKPVGMAGIELLFDNSDGSAGGQYAQYAQISVKRQVSRDGQSSYLINGVRCRRRDITDLFLGTGLGPRSYSIIEQGMISRLIEARPEDLRAFLEEAAGISKYKERRRETESRIKGARDNLSRLKDLIEEVDKQLIHLNRQAKTAEKYKEYKQKERVLKAEHLLLRRRALEQDLQRKERQLAEQQNATEAAIANQRRLEAEIEHDRERHNEANEHFNQVQGRYYAVGSEIARLEQAIQHAKETRQQQELDLEQTEQAWRESGEHQRQDNQRLQELDRALTQDEPQLAEVRQWEEAATARLAQEDQAMHAWQAEWDEFNRSAAETAQAAQVERTRINHLEQQEGERQTRLERLTEELQRMQESPLQHEIETLQGREQESLQRLEGVQEQLTRGRDAITALREGNNRHRDELDEVRAQLQTVAGRHASLEALQEAALGKDDGSVAEWLDARGLARANRLAEGIEAEPEWQRAVETVLGFHLQAVCSDGLTAGADLAALENGSLTLFDTGATVTAAHTASDSLLTKVKAPWSLASMLAHVRVAEDVEQALALRTGLQPHESVITRDGVWVGPNWLRLSHETDQGFGVLEREQQIRELAAQRTGFEQNETRLAAALEEGLERLQQQEHALEQLRQQLNELNKGLSDIRSQLSAKRAQAEHLKARREGIRGETDELQQQNQGGRQELEGARTRLHESLQQMETLSDRRAALVKRRDDLRQRLEEAREEVRKQRTAGHEVALRVESMRSAHQSLTQNLERMEGQLSHLSQRREELKAALAAAEQPLQAQAAELERQLQRRVEVEEEMRLARRALEEIEAMLRQHEQDRAAAEQKVQEERTALEQGKMQRQEVLIRYQTLDEQLGESGFTAEELLPGLPEDATKEAWEQELERMDLRIRRLGAINLAAIDEYQEQSERKQYLDAQYADVTESLETLESAIRKIDRETRTRFKETFDRVNSGLQEKFPRLFGGGHAYLQLTGEDLLDTGVTVMAQPPGKRNTSIHLLSGGEKALTAVALVFAIFELNPAPFCMLDEVDAPLDDANVGRYCELVRSMSDRVQFIFITHNKITMEMADHLTGVTMHEAGVSRLVSVDVEAAARMAAS